MRLGGGGEDRRVVVPRAEIPRDIGVNIVGARGESGVSVDGLDAPAQRPQPVRQRIGGDRRTGDKDERASADGAGKHASNAAADPAPVMSALTPAWSLIHWAVAWPTAAMRVPRERACGRAETTARAALQEENTTHANPPSVSRSRAASSCAESSGVETVRARAST